MSSVIALMITRLVPPLAGERSWAREAVATLDAARQVIEAALPRFIAGRVRARLVSFKERYNLVSGSKVWPHDADQQALIDTLRRHVVRQVGGLDGMPPRPYTIRAIGPDLQMFWLGFAKPSKKLLLINCLGGG